MILEIIFIMVIYMLLMIILLYYYRLIKSKDSYTREELKNALPFLGQFFSIISTEYSFSMVILVLFISAIIGILPLLIFNNWIINSALISLIVYFTAPLIKSRYEETQVTVTDSYADSAIGLFIRYSFIITIGISVGIASALVYNWAVFKIIHFLWLLPNLIVISGVTILSMDKMTN